MTETRPTENGRDSPSGEGGQLAGRTARRPKHEQVRLLLHAEIERMEPHTALPTERELVTRYQVSRSTVRQALDALADAGAVYRVHGAGTFVAASTISKSHRLTSFTEDMLARGLTPGSRILALDEAPAGQQVGEDLNISADALVFRLIRVRSADDRPMCLETVHLPADRCPGLIHQDLSGSLYEKLENDYGVRVVSAEQVWTAISLDERSAVLLGVPHGSPAFRVRRVGLDERERPQEATTSIYRADRYDIRMNVRRSAP